MRASSVVKGLVLLPVWLVGQLLAYVLGAALVGLLIGLQIGWYFIGVELDLSWRGVLSGAVVVLGSTLYAAHRVAERLRRSRLGSATAGWLADDDPEEAARILAARSDLGRHR